MPGTDKPLYEKSELKEGHKWFLHSYNEGSFSTHHRTLVTMQIEIIEHYDDQFVLVKEVGTRRPFHLYRASFVMSRPGNAEVWVTKERNGK